MRTPRRTALVAATTLVAGAIGALPAAADHVTARDIAAACADAPEDELTDTGTDGAEQETAVDCLVWYEVTQGRTATTYEPNAEVIRGEMAAFLARVMRASATAFEEAGATEDAFVDDEASPFEPDINFVAMHEVADGTTAATFSPGEPVLRGQMAKFLVAMLSAVGATVPEPGQDYFTDDDQSPFEDAINRVAEMGIATGVSDTAYAPAAVVSRGQMARFLARSMAALAEQELLLPPAPEEDPEAFGAPTLVEVADPTFHLTSGCTSTTSEASASHVQLGFAFDRPITGRSVAGQADRFALVGYDATRTPGVTAQLSTADDRVAEVCFPVDAWSTATTAAVARDAVRQLDGTPNAEADLGLTRVTLTGTTAPDLVDAGPVSTSRFAFTFDEPIASTTDTGYRLVSSDGDVYDSVEAEADGTIVVATFRGGFGDDPIVRAAALRGAATSSLGDGDDNAVSVLDLVDDGASDGPHLAGVTYDPGATRERTVTTTGPLGIPTTETVTVPVDEATFTFDVSVVERAGNEDAFVLVGADGEATTPSEEEDAVRRSTDDGRSIVVAYPDGTLETVTRAVVLADAVQAVAGDQPRNEVDAEPRTPALTYPAGLTLAPALARATVDTSTTPCVSDGTPALCTQVDVALVFDQPVAPDSVDGRTGTVTVYDTAGHAYTLPDAPTVDADDPTLVTVTATTTDEDQIATATDAALVGLAPTTVADPDGNANHAQSIQP